MNTDLSWPRTFFELQTIKAVALKTEVGTVVLNS